MTRWFDTGRHGVVSKGGRPYDGIKAFSETDQSGDLRAITLPALVLHGEDDQIVPIDAPSRCCRVAC